MSEEKGNMSNMVYQVTYVDGWVETVTALSVTVAPGGAAVFHGTEGVVLVLAPGEYRSVRRVDTDSREG